MTVTSSCWRSTKAFIFACLVGFVGVTVVFGLRGLMVDSDEVPFRLLARRGRASLEFVFDSFWFFG